MLRIYRNKIQIYGEQALRRLLSNPSLEEFLRLAHEFSRNVGMLSKDLDEYIKSLLKPYKDYVIGYYVKKNLAVIVCEESIINDIKEHIIKKGKPEVFVHSIDHSGWRLEYVGL